MNSKQNHNHGALTREEIRTYQSTTDQKLKNSIERKAASSGFDSDALEGWSESGVDLSAMKKLDRKFKSTWNVYLAIALLGIVPITFLILFFVSPNEKERTTLVAETESTREVQIEKTDILVPVDIESMVELPVKEQIQVKQIIKDFQEQLQETKTGSSPAESIDQLPTKPMEEPVVRKPEKELLFGKEIYLKDLKVLDYRSYRSKPTISTEQLVLTGTPADRSDRQTATEDEFVWKTVDIPYIDYLEKTMELFAKGNNKKALTRFEEILKTYPDDINALFYAGLCYYNLKEYSKAIDVFAKCESHKFANFVEESQWYHARSLIAQGNKESAKVVLREIVEQQGYYAKQAEKLLKN